jgi:dCTP deaminase
MILSDKTIRAKIKNGEITITPFDDKCIQPASYDLHLGTKGLVFNKRRHHIIDVREPVTDLMVPVDIDEDGFVLHPGEFLLANVEEVTGVDAKHVGRLEGKSSLGRLGLIIHATAGFLDPGNCLKMTLEIANLSELPIKIYPGMKIAQIAFEELDQACEKPYGSQGLNSKYKGDMTVVESKMYQNFEKSK